jgi:hypothetical protein
MQDGAWRLLATTITATNEKRIGITKEIVAGKGERIDGVRVELTVGAELSLIYDGPADSATCNVLFDGMPIRTATLSSGVIERVLVPPGRIELRWEDATSTGHVESIDVDAGEERTVTLDTDL